jgi:hypothetical protein
VAPLRDPGDPRRRRWRTIAKWSAAAVGILFVAWLLTPTGRYLLRAGWEEARILARRERIADLVRDPGLADSTRA